MNSNYTSLKEYYKNQNNLVPKHYYSEEYKDEYKVAKFEIARTNTSNLFGLVNIDKKIAKNPQEQQLTLTSDNNYINSVNNNGFLTLKADNLPKGVEIMSVDLFMNYSNTWVPNFSLTNNTSFQYFSYDNTKNIPEIYIGKNPNLDKDTSGASLQSLVLKILNLTDVTPYFPNPFARIYITYK
jgi:hypothetical protein